MTAVSRSKPVAPARRLVPDHANELVHTVAATPADDPSRTAVRAKAIVAWLPLARHLACRYRGRNEPTDDLVQAATLGLINAVDRFDANRGGDFAAYAIPTILGEVRRHFRDRTWAVRPPRQAQELLLTMADATGSLAQSIQRSPVTADLAGYLGVSPDELQKALAGALAYRAVSLSTPIGADGGRELGDTLGACDHDLDLVETRMVLGPLLSGLDARSQTILLLRFYGNLSQSEIGRKLGLSQMHISRLMSVALAALRERLDSGDETTDWRTRRSDPRVRPRSEVARSSGGSQPRSASIHR
jgi:RNA polymerase sigma-B factor